MVFTLFHVLLKVLPEVHQGLLDLAVKLSKTGGGTRSGPPDGRRGRRRGALSPTPQGKVDSGTVAWATRQEGRKRAPGVRSPVRGGPLSWRGPGVHTNGLRDWLVSEAFWALHPLPPTSCLLSIPRAARRVLLRCPSPFPSPLGTSWGQKPKAHLCVPKHFAQRLPHVRHLIRGTQVSSLC